MKITYERARSSERVEFYISTDAGERRGRWVAEKRASGWGVYRSGYWHRAGSTLEEARMRAKAFARFPIGRTRGRTSPALESNLDDLSFEGEEWL